MAADDPAPPWRTTYSAELERGYDLRAAFPDYAGYFADWSTRSEAVRRELNPVVDIPYGSSALERLDVFAARGAHRPLQVYIHGGYWRAMDKSDFSFIAAPFVALDLPLALVNYTLCPQGSMSNLVAEVRAACLWLAANAPRFGARPGELHLIGWSAGAHLAAMMTATQWPRVGTGAPACTIKSVLAISGVYDLHPVRHVSANEDLRMDDAEAQAISPLFQTPDPASRIGIAYGALETAAFRTQSQALAQRWKVESTLELEGRHHYAAMDEIAAGNSQLFRLALDLQRDPTS
jgi:arylformamidase